MSMGINQEIMDVIEMLINDKLASSSFLILKSGNVIQVNSPTKYTIRIDGVDYSASSISGLILNIGDSVQVISDLSDKRDKIIIRKVGG